jgi:RNA polymerase sigma factor (sigma-70 family)
MSGISPESIVLLFDRYAPALELYAAQWVATPADVVQEAFLRLVRQAQLPDRPAAWLYRVVRNAAISASRHEARRARREQAAGSENRLLFENDYGSPLDAEAAAKALQSLADDEREILVARIWGELTFDEIADMTGISSSAAQRRYDSAVAALRKKLGVTWLTKTTLATRRAR